MVDLSTSGQMHNKMEFVINITLLKVNILGMVDGKTTVLKSVMLRMSKERNSEGERTNMIGQSHKKPTQKKLQEKRPGFGSWLGLGVFFYRRDNFLRIYFPKEVFFLPKSGFEPGLWLQKETKPLVAPE